jgi:hypothetical protein
MELFERLLWAGFNIRGQFSAAFSVRNDFTPLCAYNQWER